MAFIYSTFTLRLLRDVLHDRPAESALVDELDVLDDRDTCLRELNTNLDDGSRHVDGDSILSRVVRDRVDGCTVLAKCIVDAVTAGSRVGKSDLGRAVVCVRFLGARKTDGTRDS